MTLHQDLVLAICGVTISVWLLLFCIYWNRFQINERIQHTCDVHMHSQGFISPLTTIERRYRQDPFYIRHQKTHMWLVGILVLTYLGSMAMVSKESMEFLIHQPITVLLALSVFITGVTDVMYIPYKTIQHTRQLKLTPHYLNHFHAVRYNKGMQNAIYFLKVMIIITAIIAQLQIALII